MELRNHPWDARMDGIQGPAVEALLAVWSNTGPNDRAAVFARAALHMSLGRQAMAEMPRISRPTIRVWISDVPSGITDPRVSRKIRSIG